jgi:hypothetical protein
VKLILAISWLYLSLFQGLKPVKKKVRPHSALSMHYFRGSLSGSQIAAGELIRRQVKGGQEGIVVKHFLKVGQLPDGISGKVAEAAAAWS